MKKLKVLLLPILLIVLILSACNKNNDAAGDAQAIYTQAAATVAAQLTEIASQDALKQPTETVTVEQEPTSVETPKTSPTATKLVSTEVAATVPSQCSNVANFVEDVTVPDGATFSPGESFTKTWKMINNGTCTWTSNYKIVFIDGDNLGAAAETPLTTGVEVPGGALINISVNLTAPEIEGDYSAYFKFKTDSGEVFGINNDGRSNFYVTIKVVKPAPTATKTPVPTATPLSTATPEATATPEPTADS